MIVAFPNQIPGRAEADAQAWLVRTMSFQPVAERIGAFTVLPMTIRHYAALRIIQSPFLPPFATPSRADLAAFLWALHPGFTVGPSCARWRHFRRCRSFARNLGLEAELVCKSREFVGEAMIDRPPAAGGRREPDYFSDECSIVGTLAREYGWSEESILQIPLKRIFQYLKEIRANFMASNGKKPVLWNPSDQITGNYLDEINRRNN